MKKEQAQVVIDLYTQMELGDKFIKSDLNPELHVVERGEKIYLIFEYDTTEIALREEETNVTEMVREESTYVCVELIDVWHAMENIQGELNDAENKLS